MKKSFMTVLLVLMLLLPATCLAGFTVSSDSKNYNLITGVYELKGNVVVQLPVQGSEMKIVADWAKVQMWQQEVHAKGKVQLDWGDLIFKCQEVDVYHTESTAYMTGSLNFSGKKHKITSDKGTYCWKTKLATFEGNVVVDGTPKNGVYKLSFK